MSEIVARRLERDENRDPPEGAVLRCGRTLVDQLALAYLAAADLGPTAAR